MKKAFLIAIISLINSHSFAAIVKSAKLDASEKNILIDVVYGGGCAKHDFALKLDGCYESYPVQCEAKLVDQTVDYCEALVSDTVVIPLAKYGLNDSYYQHGSLTITGDIDWQTKKPSSVKVTLP